MFFKRSYPYQLIANIVILIDVKFFFEGKKYVKIVCLQIF